MKRLLWLLVSLSAFAATSFGQYGITTTGLPIASLNQFYSAAVQTNSASLATACTITSGALPAGLGIQVSGTGCMISGTPTVAAPSNFSMTISNNNAQTTPPVAFLVQVFGITSGTLPNGSLNNAYNFQFRANGGSSYQWTLLSGALPPGLLLGSSGVLSGTPQGAGHFTFTVRVNDTGTGLTDAHSFAMDVIDPGTTLPPPGFQIIASTLPNANAGQFYSVAIQTSGAISGISSCTLVGGVIPPGFSMNPSGSACVLAGTTLVNGTFGFQVQAMDGQGHVTPTVAFSLFVSGGGTQQPGGLTVTTAQAPNGTTGSAYLLNGVAFQFAATGGAGNYTWSVDSGNLPTGLTLSNTGVLSGTPTQAGSFTFTLRVTSSGVLTAPAQVATKTFVVTIASGGLSVVETTLPSANAGQAYTFALHASGGTPPYRWALGNTTLQGITIDPNSGLISGTPAVAGTFTLPVTVTDSSVRQSTTTFTLVVATPFAILNTALPNGLSGVAYSQSLQASGGQAPYSWTVSSGTLPPGLTLSSAGVLSGTPTTDGTYTVTILATDAVARSSSKLFSILIGAPGIVQILTTTLPDGAVGIQYSQAVVASGGQTPYAWSVATGTLPPGLTLGASSGVITGTPTQGGNYSFSVQALDAVGHPASKVLSINITTSGLTVTPAQVGFSFVVGGAGPPSQTVKVTSTNALNFTVAANVPWLSILPTSATTPATLTLSVNPGGLAVGVYSAIVTLTPTGGTDTPQTFAVTLTVATTAGLTVAPTALNFTYQSNGAIPPAQNLVIGGNAGMSFTAVAAGGTWLSVNPVSGVTPATLSVSANPSGLPPGIYSGSVTITGTGTPAPVQVVPVTLTVLASVGPPLVPSANTLSFTYQVEGSLNPSQTLRLTSDTPVVFAALSQAPWLTVSPTVGTTPANLLVSVNPAGMAAGVYNGSIVITGGASNSPLTIPVTLTISSLSQPTITAILNGASFASGPLAPGEIVAIGGVGIGPLTPATLTLDQNNKVQTSLAGVQVLFNGVPAPLIYVSSTQINAVVPYEVAGSINLSVIVRFQQGSSVPFAATLASSAPGLFSANASGSGPGAILNQDNQPNSPQLPAKRGDFVVLYLTGEGQTTPSGMTGSVTQVSSTKPITPQPVLPVSVTIGGQGVPVAFVGEAPGVVAGVLQINVQIPQNVGTGDLPLQVTVGTIRSQNGITISVQ